MRVWLRDRYGNGALSTDADEGASYLLLAAEDEEEVARLERIESRSDLADRVGGITGYLYAIKVPVHDVLELAAKASG